MTTLPDSFSVQFQQLLTQLEKETGKIYKINLREAGKNKDLIFGDLTQRGPYRVSEMITDYEALNGTYPTYDDVQRKILELCLPGSKLTPWKEFYTWTCPKCGKDVEDQGTWVKRNVAQSRAICYFCRHHMSSIWDDVVIRLETQTISLSDGGSSVVILRPIGKITF